MAKQAAVQHDQNRLPVAYKTLALPESGNPLAWLVEWDLKADDVGMPATEFVYGKRTVQVEGEYFQVLIEGSNDGAHYHTLHDNNGQALEVAESGLFTIAELCRFVRPHCTTGDGVVKVILLLRRDTPML